MTEFFIEFFNIVLAYFPIYALTLNPMWKTRDVKTKTVLIVFLSITLVQCTALIFFQMTNDLDMEALQLFKLCAGLPTVIMPFYIFRKRFLQNLFLLALSFSYILIPRGIGTFAGESWFSTSAYPMFAADVVKALVIVLTLPFLLYMIRRLFNNPDMKKAVIFWRLVWLMPTAFFAVTAISSNYTFFNSVESVSLIIFKTIIFCALLLICYLFEASVRQVSDAENARRETEALTEKNLLLDSLSHMKSDYLSNLGHEIKTPLTVLSLNIQRASRLFETGGEMNKIEKALDNAGNETDRLIRMAEAAIELADMQESRGRMRELDVAGLLAHCADTYRVFLEKRGNSLTLHLQEDLPRMEGTSDSFVQVISNLLSNANAHTKNGEIVIEASANEDVIKVVVRDNGEIIDDDILYRVFERGVSSRGSTGLGLPICKNIIEAHGGKIELDNAGNQGVMVTITLPIYSKREVKGDG